jgi:hypothetical protein
MENMGYWLWEGSAFVMQLSVGMSLLVLRRKASGRPAFTDDDRRLFFSPSQLTVSMPRFWINLTMAVFLTYPIALLEHLFLAPFGASILATAQLLTILAIVKRLLCQNDCSTRLYKLND